MKTQTFTAELKAFLPEYYGPEDMKDASCVQKVHFTAGDGRYYLESGGCFVGMATITLNVMADEKDMLASKVKGLQAQLQKERADSEVKCNRILEQISKLQALEYTA